MREAPEYRPCLPTSSVKLPKRYRLEDLGDGVSEFFTARLRDFWAAVAPF
jgi:hypothetical protein